MLKRKLYLVDYEENGCDKHRAIEGIGISHPDDNEVVQIIHFYIGKNNRLSSVVEFTTDLSLIQFDKVCDTPDIFKIPHRILYVDMEEIKRVKELMNI